MFLFNWFSAKSDTSRRVESDGSRSLRTSKPTYAADKSLPPLGKPAPGPDAHLVDRKARRHARREQLYVAIRECMIRAGVLSASYKFKVLSLDQRGDQFLVMMDVAPGLSGQADKLTDIEALLINTSKSLFSIYVTAVYWRTDNRPAAANAVSFGVSRPAVLESQPAALEVVRQAAKKPDAQRYDPIHNDELAAFKRALAAASAHNSATPDGTGKSRNGLRSSTLMTGFEDTEMPEFSAAPVLSATQYGDLR